MNGEVPSSSFLPACNYSVIAQSGFVGVDVYTHAVVQDLVVVVVVNKTQICIANAHDRSGPELQSLNSFYSLTLAG